jgi:selenocysteine lyase/cysteine desulfurase
MAPGETGRPTINGKPAMHALEMWGSRDLAHFEAVAAAVDFQQEIGRERIGARGRRLAAYLRDRMRELNWAELLTPDLPEMSRSISAYRLTGYNGVDLGQELYGRYGITVPCDAAWLRVSTHYYNDFQELDRLVDGLKTLRPRA